jgi:hypothetical protein
MLQQTTALALAIGTALGSLELDVVYGMMPRASNNLQVRAYAFLYTPQSTSSSKAVLNRSTTLQNFTGNLGGVVAEPITSTGNSQRPFAVDGETFTTLSAAVQRSCGIQHTGCASTANAGHDGKDGSGLTVGQCDAQQCEY